MQGHRLDIMNLSIIVWISVLEKLCSSNICFQPRWLHISQTRQKRSGTGDFCNIYFSFSKLKITIYPFNATESGCKVSCQAINLYHFYCAFVFLLKKNAHAKQLPVSKIFFYLNIRLKNWPQWQNKKVFQSQEGQYNYTTNKITHFDNIQNIFLFFCGGKYFNKDFDPMCLFGVQVIYAWYLMVWVSLHAVKG